MDDFGCGQRFFAHPRGEVRDDTYTGVAQSELSREGSLRHHRHSDDIGSHRSKCFDFRFRFKPRTIHTDICSRGPETYSDLLSGSDQISSEIGTIRFGKIDMDNPVVSVVERRIPARGKIDDLIGNHDRAREQLLMYPPSRADRDDPLHPEFPKAPDIRFIIDFMRRYAVGRTVSCEKNDFPTAEPADPIRIRRRSIRGHEVTDISSSTRKIRHTAPADNPDHLSHLPFFQLDHAPGDGKKRSDFLDGKRTLLPAPSSSGFLAMRLPMRTILPYRPDEACHCVKKSTYH